MLQAGKLRAVLVQNPMACSLASIIVKSRLTLKDPVSFHSRVSVMLGIAVHILCGKVVKIFCASLTNRFFCRFNVRAFQRVQVQQMCSHFRIHCFSLKKKPPIE
ncbi:unnamed protein product [Ixodes pacificus]